MTDALPVPGPAPVLHLVRDVTPTDDVVAQTLDREQRNVALSLGRIDRHRFAEAAHLLAGTDRPTGQVLILSGDPCFGVAVILADRLAQLRPRVELLGGTWRQAAREFARAGCQDVVVLLDNEPSDPTVLEAARQATARRIQTVALTDPAAWPLVDGVKLTFPVSTIGAAAGDSLVGMLALVNALVAEIAARLSR